VKLLTNPLFLRMVAVFLAGAFAFFLGILLMRKVKQTVQVDITVPDRNTSADSFPLHTYHAVIQQLKQQKHELQAMQQQERRRSRTTENLSAAVLSNLSSGVLFFNTAGLVRQANSAAKSILGFAAPAGMNAFNLFRGATLQTKKAPEITSAADAVSSTLKHATVFRRLETDYVTPAGQRRVLDLTVSPVYAADAQLLGAACVIEDQTEVVEMRRSQSLRGEMSAEMALELKNSLETISGYARNLVNNYDSHTAEQLANDIAAEAGHLQRKIGGFLAGAKAAGVASGNN
jgi:nitrogen fixation/metabolism regulation signal transduction histidine kinase